MYSNSKLQTAVRLSLGMGAGALAVGFAPGALAQDASSADEPLEEIITTGSRIKRADLDSASPVTVIDREVLLAQGITDVGNLLQRMPSMSGSPIGTTTNNGGNGSVQIDLRGMGVDRTLTLVNGMRTVDGGDYQTIPANMIERVEILKDGASAVYGADAVAGVVNIITRRDFEGLEFTAQNADFFDMDDGAQTSVGMIAGKTFDSGNVMFGAEFVDQKQAFQSDAPWDYFQNSYYIYPEGCEFTLTEPYPTGCFPIGSSRVPQSRLPFYSQGLFHIGTAASQPYEVGLMTSGAAGTYNYAPVNYIQTPYERTNLFMESNFELTDTVALSVGVRGNFRQSAQELAPLPYTGGDPFHNGFYTDPVTGASVGYEGISENNYYLRRAVDAYNAANGTSLIYEPVIQPRRRMIETNRRFTQDITQIQAVFSLTGEINEMDWEVHYNQGYRSRTDVDSGQFSGARLNNALGPSADLDGDGIPECYGLPGTDPGGVDAGTLITGCVPMNMFGGGEVDPVTSQPVTTTLTQDMVDYVEVDLIDTFQFQMKQAGASLSGGGLDLPGGELGWAVGYGYWEQQYTYAPDSAKATGAATGNVGAGTDGSLYNNSIFVEVLAPVVDNGEQALDLKAGVRYDDWNAFDGETTWQFGVEFQAIDALKLRATAGTIFRAPTIDDLFAGQRDSFPTFSDPCNAANFAGSPGCAQIAPQFDNQLNAKVGGNPFLVPETGDTFTAGAVFNPEIGGDMDLTLTLDYWQVEIEDGISSLGVQFTLDDCYVNQNPASCALITRNPNYTINQVLDADINVADQGAKGIDTEVRWSMDADFGQLQASLLWSHLLERTKVARPGASEEDLSGRYTDPTAEDGGAYAENKINYSIQWMRDGLSIGYLGEYISALDADTFCNCDSDGDPSNNGPNGEYIQAIDSLLYHDIVVDYTFEEYGTNIAMGFTNLTDEEPPFMDTGFNANTDPATYRLFGRGYYIRLTQSFE